MISQLTDDRPRLVDYEKHQGVTLTPAGRNTALEIIRHHRLLELYLQQALGYSWDQVHAEAEKLEHVISEDFEDRIANLLGNPDRDPHGDRIPAKDGSINKAPFDGPLHVRVGSKSDSPAHALGKHVTDQVFVEVK